MHYPLFALSAASLYLGFARRKPKTGPESASRNLAAIPKPDAD
jgi:hypothetical protein